MKLSKYIWEYNEKYNEEPEVEWSVLKRSYACNGGSKLYRWWLKKIIINFPNHSNFLNKISELISKCPHEAKYTLCNWATNWTTWEK